MREGNHKDFVSTMSAIGQVSISTSPPKQPKDVLMYRGVDIETLSRVELIDALRVANSMIDSQRDNAERDRRVQGLFRNSR